ncbi:hypothetical protein G7046_g9285 [Stylonectria norvegica]|nr:hypothetical protein G7046_g9285 [Stylonectria norvegica]
MEEMDAIPSSTSTSPTHLATSSVSTAAAAADDRLNSTALSRKPPLLGDGVASPDPAEPPSPLTKAPLHQQPVRVPPSTRLTSPRSGSRRIFTSTTVAPDIESHAPVLPPSLTLRLARPGLPAHQPIIRRLLLITTGIRQAATQNTRRLCSARPLQFQVALVQRWNPVACPSLEMRRPSPSISRQLVSAYSLVLLQPFAHVPGSPTFVGCWPMRRTSQVPPPATTHSISHIDWKTPARTSIPDAPMLADATLLFKPSRNHRQTINRFNKYVIGDGYAKEAARLYPKSRDQAKKRDNLFDLAERIHEAEYERLTKPPEPDHRLVVTLEEDSFTEEKFLVYQNYQHVVHQDKPKDISRPGFERFLCNSPLRRETMIGEGGRKRRLGSYHQCYRLDGKLVAIGVLDLLPECVSSVYFLYHESIHKYTPGKIGALYEIALAMEEGYRWWYPGFYIHSCAKMRYKIDYIPQYILDPESLSWDPLDREVLDLLDKKPFVSLYEERQGDATESSAGEETGRNIDLKGTPHHSTEPKDGTGTRLFSAKMPGVVPLSLIAALNMDHIALRVSAAAPLYETSDLRSWEGEDVEQWSELKMAVAELLATIGPDLMDQICLDFSSS